MFPQTDIIDTYVFRSLVGQFNFSMGAAAGFYQSVFGLIIERFLNSATFSHSSSSNEDTTNSTASSTSGDGTASAPDISKEVKLVYYLWGSEGVANKDILSEINKKLKADINATVKSRNS